MTVPDPVADAEADMLAIGAHCSHPECNQLDFLPFRCSGCARIYCGEHRGATAHACPHAAAAEVQVIVCPACARAIRLEPGEDPNVAYDRHSREGCDPSNYDKVHRKRKCPVKGCRERLTTTNSLTCKDCGAAVCLRHRHGEDHACPGPRPPPSSGLRAALGGFFGSSSNSSGRQAADRGGSGGNAKPAPAVAATGAAAGPSRLASAKKKVTAAARSASGSLQAQLQDYRAAHKSKTGSNSGNTSTAAAAATVGSPAPERCSQCGQRFATVQALIDHAAAAHSDGWASGGGLNARPAAGTGGLERCPTCGAGFDDPVALVRHVETAHRTNAVSEVCVLL